MQKIKYEYTCSNCGEKKIIDIYPVINLQSDKELYNDLFSLDLFRINCENCNTVSMIQYDTLIVDMYKKYMVYYIKVYCAAGKYTGVHGLKRPILDDTLQTEERREGLLSYHGKP